MPIFCCIRLVCLHSVEPFVVFITIVALLFWRPGFVVSPSHNIDNYQCLMLNSFCLPREDKYAGFSDVGFGQASFYLGVMILQHFG